MEVAQGFDPLHRAPPKPLGAIHILWDLTMTMMQLRLDVTQSTWASWRTGTSLTLKLLFYSSNLCSHLPRKHRITRCTLGFSKHSGSSSSPNSPCLSPWRWVHPTKNPSHGTGTPRLLPDSWVGSSWSHSAFATSLRWPLGPWKLWEKSRVAVKVRTECKELLKTILYVIICNH